MFSAKKMPHGAGTDHLKEACSFIIAALVRRTDREAEECSSFGAHESDARNVKQRHVRSLTRTEQEHGACLRAVCVDFRSSMGRDLAQHGACF